MPFISDERVGHKRNNKCTFFEYTDKVRKHFLDSPVLETLYGIDDGLVPLLFHLS